MSISSWEIVVSGIFLPDMSVGESFFVGLFVEFASLLIECSLVLFDGPRPAAVLDFCKSLFEEFFERVRFVDNDEVLFPDAICAELLPPCDGIDPTCIGLGDICGLLLSSWIMLR